MTVDLIKEFFSATRLRIKSPLLSTVALVWLLCNWDRVMLLFWDNNPIANRVQHFRDTGDFIYGFIIPWSTAFVYVLLIPLLHRHIYQMNASNEEKHHAAWANLEKTKEEQKSAVEKERLKNDPSKEFLPRIVEIELLEREKEAQKLNIELEQAQLLKNREELERLAAADRLEAQAAEKAKAEAELKIAQDNAKKVEAERKSAEFLAESQIAQEAMKLDLKKQKHASQVALYQLPILLGLVFELDKTLRTDYETVLKPSTLTEIVATSLGYKSYEELSGDRLFVVERFSQIQRIVHDYRRLSSALELILSAENEEIQDVEIIISSLESIYDEMDIKFTDIDTLAEQLLEEFNSNNDLVESDAVNSAIAETNAFFGESPHLELCQIEADPDNGKITIQIDGNLTGSYDNDRMYSGHEIRLSVDVSILPLFGKASYGEYEYDISASVVDDDRYDFSPELTQIP